MLPTDAFGMLDMTAAMEDSGMFADAEDAEDDDQ